MIVNLSRSCCQQFRLDYCNGLPFNVRSLGTLSNDENKFIRSLDLVQKLVSKMRGQLAEGPHFSQEIFIDHRNHLKGGKDLPASLNFDHVFTLRWVYNFEIALFALRHELREKKRERFKFNPILWGGGKIIWGLVNRPLLVQDEKKIEL